ncbi:MAG: DUF3180 domain-containing protein [Leucobacter sp.]|nr:DUF3180 domain-containing protein [Leucobacter sp.]
MNGTTRTPWLATVAFAVVGGSAGLLLQHLRSTQGLGPLVPPLSLPFTLLVLAAVLLSLGIALRRAVTRRSGKAVNPFHAVRLLAGAKAGQYAGALFGGFGAGLVLQLLSRAVMPPPPSWLPMALVFAAGLVLVICGIITESLCRVPPTDPENEEEATQGEAEPGAA